MALAKSLNCNAHYKMKKHINGAAYKLNHNFAIDPCNVMGVHKRGCGGAYDSHMHRWGTRNDFPKVHNPGWNCRRHVVRTSDPLLCRANTMKSGSVNDDKHSHVPCSGVSRFLLTSPETPPSPRLWYFLFRLCLFYFYFKNELSPSLIVSPECMQLCF